MDGIPVSTRSTVTCAHCGGSCLPQYITLTLQTAQFGLVVFRNVPADVCQACGEEQFGLLTSGHMLTLLRLDCAPDDFIRIPIYDLTARRS
jgi:YgiT-type zinc finger domain-containing protein